MAEVRLFRGLRYDAGRVTLSDVVCPPYDVISAVEARGYRARSPYNAVRLHMPLEDDESLGQDRYAHAATELAQWQREGVLVRDELPSLYVLEQRFRGPDGVTRRRRGFIGRLRLESPASGAVAPRVDQSGAATAIGSTSCAPRTPTSARSSCSTPTTSNMSGAPPAGRRVGHGRRAGRRGTVHTLRSASRPQAEEAAALLAERSLVIADGHHRHATALT